MQVHFTIASQFYVHVDVGLSLHVFLHLYGGEKTGMLKFLLIFFSLRPRILVSNAFLYTTDKTNQNLNSVFPDFKQDNQLPQT